MGTAALLPGRRRDCTRDVRAGRHGAPARGLAGVAPVDRRRNCRDRRVAFTAWSEWYNVYRAGNWGYTASMPLIFGIGLSPLLQWLILPPAMVAAYRTLVPVLFGQHTAQKPYSNTRCYEGTAMKADVNRSHQAHAHDHRSRGIHACRRRTGSERRPLHLPDAPGDRA